MFKTPPLTVLEPKMSFEATEQPILFIISRICERPYTKLEPILLPSFCLKSPLSMQLINNFLKRDFLNNYQ